MSKHNKTCRVCIRREVKQANATHKTLWSRCITLEMEVKRDHPECQHFKEKKVAE
jgi:hypothetical protein